MELITPEPLQVECKRCGNCCRKGSPTLHMTDAALLKSGKLTYKYLYTIRKGELVYNNIDDEFINIDYEVIKVLEKKESRVCNFLASESNDCTIYKNRPIQCSSFECWNTEKLIAAFAEEKLTRLQLIGEDKTLRNIIETHDEKCSYATLDKLFEKVQTGEDVVNDIYAIIQYDLDIRPLLTEKMSIPEDYLPLLLGRPLTETIEMFGYRVEKDSDGNLSLINYTVK